MDIKATIQKIFPLVIIKWIDAESDSDWESLERTKEWCEEDHVIQEVGWLLTEGKKYLTICSQVSKKDDNFGNKTKIPKKWVIERTELIIAKPKRKKK